MNTLVRWFYCLLGLFLLILAIEGSLRWVFPQPARGFSERLFENREGLTLLRAGIKGKQNGREFSVDIEGDSQGYRLGTSAAREEGEPRFWLFGDSFAFGWGVEADQTASAVLSKKGIPVANYGMPKDGLKEYLRRLNRQMSSGEKGAGIIFLIYDNDMVDDPGSFPDPWQLQLRHKILQSHLVRWIARGIDQLGWSSRVADGTGYRQGKRRVLNQDLSLHRTGTIASDEFLSVSEKLRTLLKRARSNDVPVWVVRLTPVYAANGFETAEALRFLELKAGEFDFNALNKALAALCEREGVRYSTFAPTTAEQERSWYFPYDLHLTAEGHKALAGHMVQELNASVVE